MAARQASSQTLKSITGAFFVALGFVILFSNLDGVATSACSFAGISPHEAPGILPAFGLAGLHALQTYTFDHDAFLSGLRQILVSFWPLILVAFGAVLFGSAFRGRFATAQVKVAL